MSNNNQSPEVSPDNSHVQTQVSASSADPLLPPRPTTAADPTDVMVNIQDNPGSSTVAKNSDVIPLRPRRPKRLEFPCGRPREFKIELNGKWNEKIAEENLFGGIGRQASRKPKKPIETLFKMKTCKHFIPDEKDPSTCKCKRLDSDHDKSEPFSTDETEGKWDAKKHAKEIPCDYFGDVELTDKSGSKKVSKYIRLSDETDPATILDLFLKRWGIKEPNIIISVTGGALDFQLDRELSVQFKKGLVKTAADTGAWIVTGGTNTGVMAYVGAAVAEQPLRVQRNLTLIGVAAYGILFNKDKLAGKNVKGQKAEYALPVPGEKGIPLNPDHTHFILVDNGSIGNFGVEINLRSKFENHVKNNLGKDEVPSDAERKSSRMEEIDESEESSEKRKTGCQAVCILLEGGPNSAETLYSSLAKKVPCVVASNSGRASDIITYAKENTKYEMDPITRRRMGRFDGDVLVKLETEMLNSYDWRKLPEEKRRENLDKQLMFLREICAEDNNKYVTIYSIRDPLNNDLDKVILGALMRAMQKDEKEPDEEDLKRQLFFSVKWNRPDSARENIFNRSRNKFQPEYLQSVFVECMLENKFEFVNLLLDCGVTMEMFKNVVVLEQLFIYKNNQNDRTFYQFMDSIVMKRCPTVPFFLAMLRGMKHLIGGGFQFAMLSDDFVQRYTEYYNKRVAWEKRENRELTMNELMELDPPEVKDPTFVLFLWAILMHYHEMAKIFWRFGDNYQAKALIAMRMYTTMGEQFSNMDPEVLEEYIQDFSDLAMELLQRCYKANENDSSQMIVSNLSSCKSHSVLGLAVLAEHEDFIAHASSQTVLNEIWSGGIKQCDDMTLRVLVSLFFPPLALFLFDYDTLGNIFASQHDREDGDKDNAIRRTAMNYVEAEDERGSEDEKSIFTKWYLFFSSPVAKFWFTTLLFFVFLILYTYFVLGELPHEQPYIEIVLAFFVLSITTEEIRQVLTESGKAGEYFTSIWNWIDVFGVTLFWVAFGMRFIPDDTVRNVARLLYILDVFFWFMRVLNIFTINRKLGPLVTIILTMIPELLRFFFIWILFMLAFGVIVKSVSEPKRYGEVSFVDMLQIVDMSYWQTYGELFLEDLQDDEKLTNCTKHYDDGSGLQPCPFLPEASLFFTAIYMIIGNILLMNLLIALFTSIYEQVNEKSLTDWKNKRLDVIVEYHTRPPIPPPFSIIYHLFLLLRWKSHMQEVKQSKGLTLDVSTSRMYELLMFEEEVKEEFMMERSSRQGEDVSKQVVQLTQKFDEADKGLRTQIALLENQSRENGKQLAQIQEMLQQLLDKQS